MLPLIGQSIRVMEFNLLAKHCMKPWYVFIAVFLLRCVSQGEILIPSQVDSAHSEAREKTFTPWSTPEESGNYWKKLSSSNIPIYREVKGGDLDRHLYIPNPGTGYWVLGGLSEKALWKTHNEKLKNGDELVSAAIFKDDKGAVTYWALWAPENKSYLLKDKMREFGISPANVEFTTLDKLRMLSLNLAPFTAVAVFGTLILSLVLLSITSVLLLISRKRL